jgi:hypothetical protein
MGRSNFIKTWYVSGDAGLIVMLKRFLGYYSVGFALRVGTVGCSLFGDFICCKLVEVPITALLSQWVKVAVLVTMYSDM